ncbi:MAG: hypothetical protein P4M11_07165 [Candidatus Pacebacteria bacterium]|nr:hypothetical protein [Candidatus Paceibacterota bacterium]
MPAVVYEVEYPQSKGGFRPRYFFLKLTFAIMLVVMKIALTRCEGAGVPYDQRLLGPPLQ